MAIEFVGNAEATDWLAHFLDSYPVFEGSAKPMTKREKKLVEYAYANGYLQGQKAEQRLSK